MSDGVMWEAFWMQPIYGDGFVLDEGGAMSGGGAPDIVIGYDAVHALRRARRAWPEADAVRILGNADPANPEYVLNAQEKWPHAQWLIFADDNGATLTGSAPPFRADSPVIEVAKFVADGFGRFIKREDAARARALLAITQERADD